MNSSRELPLAILFGRAEAFVETCERLKSKSERQEALNLLYACEERIDALGVFSSNEQLEDVTTGDLKYLLVSSFLGNFLSTINERDPTAKSELLQSSLSAYTRFLRLCEQYGLVPLEARHASSADPQTKRELKIQRFQKEKLARARLKDLHSLLPGNTLTSKEDSGRDLDEDAEREAWLLKIELAVLKAFDQSSQIQQEIELLSHASSLPKEERSKPLPPPPTDLLGELHAAAANLGKHRQEVAANVFRPSHRLPTRSLREQADIEIAQAQQQAADQEQAAKIRAGLEADEEYALQKQRNWDDWKDEHERGAGNDKLRPTA